MGFMRVFQGDREWWTTLHLIVEEGMIKEVQGWETKFYDGEAVDQSWGAAAQESNIGGRTSEGKKDWRKN